MYASSVGPKSLSVSAHSTTVSKLVRNVKLGFEQRIDRDSIDFYIRIRENGKTYRAKPVDLTFDESSECSLWTQPTFSIDQADYYQFVKSLVDFMAMRGMFGQDEKELKRVEAHLEDMRSLVFKNT